MNATIPANLRIVSTHSSASQVEVWGIPMLCEFEYDPGEAPILFPTDSAHPGSPPNAQLLSCKVGGVEIIDMLSNCQRERIEESCISEMENI